MSIAQNKYSLKRTFLFCYSILLVVLLLASANNNSSILLYLLIIGSSLLLLNPVYLIPVYFVSSLSSPYFAAGDNIGTGRIIGFILIISGLVYMTRSPHKINKKICFT